MTQNIEQRTANAVKSYEQASNIASRFAEADETIQTPSGPRKSLPKVSREAEDDFAVQRSKHDKSFQERWAISQQAIPWSANSVISDSLQRYTVGSLGETEYKELLPNPEKLPFETSSTIAEDLAMNRWLENGVPNKNFVNEWDGISQEEISGLKIFPQRLDLSVVVGEPTYGVIPENTDAVRVNGKILMLLPKRFGVIESITPEILTFKDGTRSFLAEHAYTRKRAKNAFWMGEFNAWIESSAYKSEDYRRMVCDGWTLARLNFTEGVFVSQSIGVRTPTAVRITRNADNDKTENAILVANLAQVESETLKGELCGFKIFGHKGKDFTGENVTVRVQYSVEPEQAIVNSNGTYTNGNEILLSKAINFSVPDNTFFFEDYIYVPNDATQVSVVIDIPFNGVAPGGLGPEAGDWIEVESVVLSPCMLERVIERPYSDVVKKANSRFCTSFPLGSPVPVLTTAGQIKVVAVNDNPVNGVMSRISFGPMIVPPTVVIFAPGDGKDMKIWDEAAGARVNAMIYDISESGATVTSNGAITAGNVYTYHYCVRAML